MLSPSPRKTTKKSRKGRERERERLLSLAFQYARKACFDDASLFCLDFKVLFFGAFFFFLITKTSHETFFFLM